MSTIERFYTSTATIVRKVAGTDENDNYIQEEAEVCSFACHKQQASPEMAQYVGQTLAKTHSVWCAVGTPVSEGDTLLIGDDYYTVHSVQRQDTGRNQHLELTVVHGGVQS